MRLQITAVAAVILFLVMFSGRSIAAETQRMFAPSITIYCNVSHDFLSTGFCSSYNCTVNNDSYVYRITSNNSLNIQIMENKIIILNTFRGSSDYQNISARLCTENIIPIFDFLGNRTVGGVVFHPYSESLLAQSELDKNDFSKCSYVSYQRVGDWLLEHKAEKTCFASVINWIILIPALVFAGIPVFAGGIMGYYGGLCSGTPFLFGIIYAYLLACLIHWLRVGRKEKKGLVDSLKPTSKTKLALFVLLLLLFFLSVIFLYNYFSFCVAYAM